MRIDLQPSVRVCHGRRRAATTAAEPPGRSHRATGRSPGMMCPRRRRPARSSRQTEFAGVVRPPITRPGGASGDGALVVAPTGCVGEELGALGSVGVNRRNRPSALDDVGHAQEWAPPAAAARPRRSRVTAFSRGWLCERRPSWLTSIPGAERACSNKAGDGTSASCARRDRSNQFRQRSRFGRAKASSCSAG